MSINECERKGCSNLLCDKIILDQYICNECLAELKENAKCLLHSMVRKQYNEFIKSFMNSDKQDTETIDIMKELNNV